MHRLKQAGPKYWELVGKKWWKFVEVSAEGGSGAAAEFDGFGLVLVPGRKGRGERPDSDPGERSCGILRRRSSHTKVDFRALKSEFQATFDAWARYS